MVESHCAKALWDKCMILKVNKSLVGHQLSVISHQSLVGGKIKNFVIPWVPCGPQVMRTNNKDSITWVPVSSTGMTEFL